MAKSKSKTKSRNKSTASMKMKAPGAKNSIDKMKYEIANEFGVNLGPNASSRDNGKVGGEITKRLIENSMNKNTTSKKQKTTNKKGRKSK